jgi:hypothetical protein
MIKATLQRLILCAGLLVAHAAGADTIQVIGNLTGTINWRNTNEYVLNGFVYVLEGGVLNIEPGTVIRGKAGTGTSSASLFITRGAKIFANGTEHSPIIFCSEADDLLDPNDIPLWTRNLWGGIVIFGKSVLNTPSDVTGRGANPKYDIFEGLPDTVINGQNVNRFGGNDDNDDSGVMRYCSIRNSSTIILLDREINGLSLCGVGRGTKIENIEVFAAGDDSIEFFGGTVNTKYIASIFSDDDNMDIDLGYRGKNQFWFILQAPDRKDHGGEWNGEPNGIGVGNSPVANFEIYNATFVGPGPTQTGARALISRVYCAPKVFNSIFTEFNIGINIDDTSNPHFVSGLAKFQHNNLWNFAAGGVAAPYGQNAAALAVINDSANSNTFVDPLLRSISRTNVPAFRLDPRPATNSPVLTSALTAPDDGFYKPVSYKGAFANVNWASDWTFAAEAGLITGEGAGTPVNIVEPPPCLAVSVSISSSAGNVTLSLSSLTGKTYTIESTTDLNLGWGTEVSGIAGTGGTITRQFSSDTGNKFYRVVCNN